MIRNMEYRKFVASFPWFAWLSEVMEEYLPWSGDVSAHCAPEIIMEQFRATPSKAEIKREVRKMRKELIKEMRSEIKESEKKTTAAIKRLKTDNVKKFEEMNKKINELEKK